MKARIKWVEDRTFTGQSETGHVIPFGTSVGPDGANCARARWSWC